MAGQSQVATREREKKSDDSDVVRKWWWEEGGLLEVLQGRVYHRFGIFLSLSFFTIYFSSFKAI